MSLPYVYQNTAGPGRGIRVRVLANDAVPDMTVVTGASLFVSLRDGTRMEWDAEIEEQTADELLLVHELAADGSDVAAAGIYRVVAYVTTPGGTRQCLPASLQVRRSV